MDENEVLRLRKRLEREKKARKTAEAITEEKTRELFKNNEVLKAQKALLAKRTKQLEQSNHYKDEFLANLSHELRTPLNAQISFTELLLEGEGDDKPTDSQKELLAYIKDSANQLLALIKAILDMSELTAGSLTADRETVAVTTITGELLNKYQKPASDKKLELTCDIGGEVPDSIETDPVQLRRALGDLLDNAIKFTEKGKVQLTLDVTDAPDGQWLFKVKDSGIGIPKAHQSYIFEPFRQGDGSACRQYGGLGMGLALCKKRAELLGGDIYLAESSPDQEGAEFVLTIPRDKI